MFFITWLATHTAWPSPITESSTWPTARSPSDGRTTLTEVSTGRWRSVAKNSFVASSCTCCRVDSCGSASSASLPIGAAPNCCHYVNSYWKSAPVKVPRHPPPGRPSYLLPGCVHAAGVRWSWSRDSVRRRSHGSSPKRATSLTLHNPYSSSNPLHAPARAPEVCPLTQKRGKTTTMHSAPISGVSFPQVALPRQRRLNALKAHNHALLGVQKPIQNA